MDIMDGIAEVGYVGLGKETVRLYDLERKSNDMIMQAAQELAKVVGYNKDEFWLKALPRSLVVVLDSFAFDATVPAIKAWVLMNWLKSGHVRELADWFVEVKKSFE